MRARRREREHVNGGRSQGPRRGDAGGDASGGTGNAVPKANRNRKRRNRKRRPRAEGPRNHDVGFWGDPERLPEPTQDVRITDDAAAVARSLGAPPLPGHERIASHYFTVVYERAVTIAGALAAAGGLIDPEALTEERSD